MPRRKRSKLAEVVDLAEARALRRLATYREKMGQALDSNRRAIGRLCSIGALFTAEGTRVGRDLLLAHQHLLRVVALLERLSNRGDVPAPRRPTQVGALFSELDQLLDRTSELTTRTGEYWARLRGD
ncbi:MAG: hypothetical protein HYZ28_25655 [Myxococcales bacterium]|nr:hypothetical protein [Myxococcales bacterium]